MCKVIYLFIVLLSQQLVYSQGVFERIYLQTDRSQYAAGETIYFKGFLLSDIDTIESANLFVELWDATHHQLGQVGQPVIDGTASGTISIPRELKSTWVFIRAYTEVTASQHSPYQFVKPVLYPAAFNPSSIMGNALQEPLFFPEGGKLVMNARNHIAFKAMPGFSGTIRNNKGETLATINPEFNGMGHFTLSPKSGENYSCYWQSNGKEWSKELPAAIENGIALHLRQTADTLYFDLDNGGNRNLSVLKPKIQLMISNEVAYLVGLNMTTRSSFSYFIPLLDYRAGMAELRVLDDQENLLAARPVFIGRHSLAAGNTMEVVKKDLGKRGENRLIFHVPDTSLRYLSVSISDAAYHTGSAGPVFMNAFTGANQWSDRSGWNQVRNPDQLDLLIQTTIPSGAIISKDNQPAKSSPPSSMQLSGTVKRGKKILANKEVLIGIRSAYTGKELYKVTTDDQGNFALDGIIVYGEALVHCRLPGNAEEELTVSFNLRQPSANVEKTFFDAYQQIAGSFLDAGSTNTVPLVTSITATADDTLILAEKVITLDEVVVKSDPKLVERKRLEVLEDKYVNGTPFSGYSATGEALDVMNDPLSAKYLDLFSYIGMNMRSVSMRPVNGTKQLFYFGRGTGGQSMVTVFYLNNSKVDRDMLEAITWTRWPL
ncbi:MAG: hypothetical protein IPG86_00380 [Chitinophagaceae bacterium]|nr:hypothetical protein [Chitinophagaceae bacterium]